jgi:aspartate racemase
LLHIADPTALAIKAAQLHTIALLGTRFTMEQDFYVGRLRAKHGLNVLLPDQQERDEVHRVIYEELVHGKVLPKSKQGYLRIIERLRDQGAQAVVLGCTEIALLIQAGESAIPCFDTTDLHAAEAVDFALKP